VNWKEYSDLSLKRLWWRALKKTTMMCHWKGYDDGWQITEKAMMMYTEKTTLTCHWKDYDDMWWITEKVRWRVLKRLLWCVTEKATMTGDRSLKWLWWRTLKRLLWHVTEKATITGDGSLKSLDDVHWKDYSDVSLKSYDDGWQIIEKAMITVYAIFLQNYICNYYTGSWVYKSISWGRELRCVHM
jgi:hypothetical protein